MSESLFSYGTLQIEKTQIDLYGRILKGSADVLPVYRVLTIDINDESFFLKGEQKTSKQPYFLIIRRIVSKAQFAKLRQKNSASLMKMSQAAMKGLKWCFSQEKKHGSTFL